MDFPHHLIYEGAVYAVYNENLLNILRSANVALFYKDLSGRYLFINEAGARMIGERPGDIVGRHDREIFAPRTADVIALRDTHIASMRDPLAYDCRSTLLNAHSIGFHSVKVAIRTPERREPVGLVCLSVERSLARPLVADMRDLLKNLVQFRPERLLAICRRGARLNLI